MKGYTKLAFTLAELMIVIGLIGIVAESTIPTLIADFQKKSYKIAAKNAYSNLAQVLNSMRRDSGGSLDIYQTTDRTLKPELVKYLKVIKDCGWATCVPTSYTSDIYTSLSGDPANTAFGGEGQFVTADGMFYNIQNLGTVHPNSLAITVDVNGYEKKPNVYGIDTFCFEINGEDIFPMGALNSEYLSTTYCKKATHSAYQGIGCMDKVMQGLDY